MSNGAKALAERLHDTEYHPCTGDYESCAALGGRIPPWLDHADAILANGAVFLTAEEAERLRRIETAAKAVLVELDIIRHIRETNAPPRYGLVVHIDTHADLTRALNEPSHD